MVYIKMNYQTKSKPIAIVRVSLVEFNLLQFDNASRSGPGSDVFSPIFWLLQLHFAQSNISTIGAF
jgi:hypothetical protein